MADHEVSEADIAIVGMSGRFPGADDVDQLWDRVVRGDDCLIDLDADALIRAGVPESTVDDPAYVRRTGALADVAGFDARFFGIGERDAALMDPQHRHFLECAWEALESAAHVPERFSGAIGVFAGCGMNTYLLNNILTNPNLIGDLGWFLVRHTGNDKDFLPTFVSYKLDLRGPSISVQTACSTSLVAVHLAVQSLLAFECDLALAGGSTIEVPHGVGYHYREGEILAPDGRCRAFDARSQGTVLASGTAAVALRRLADALDDGDPVLAVIKGSAVNNDGSRKVGFLAPSVDGHAEVVKEALAVAGLSARDIGLLEAHGTGTAVGDPIEVAALTEAFRASTAESGFCRLTSTKPNIGHLDTAAGAASLVKAVQALRHRTLPPLANFTAPSPLLDLERSPFVLSGTSATWEAEGPRRAGVSSLGVGGTNAHVVLEEAPAPAPTPPAAPEQVLCLSGQVSDAVEAAGARLAAALAADPAINLADVAHTLFSGRRAMARRRVVVATDRAGAVDALTGGEPRRSFEGTAPDEVPSLVFLFPGGGSQYVGMGAGLDDRFDVYHRTVREGIEIVVRLGGPDLAPLLDVGGDDEALRQAEASLPAVFVVSVALARQWMHWGAKPDAFAGHSLGEYVAAHLAGVMSFEDALRLVVTRSRLMASSTAGGAMLVVSMAEDELRAVLPDELSLAVVNASDECVVAGPAAAIDRLSERLTTDEIPNRLIPLAAAAHSSLLDPVLEEFGAVVRTVQLAPPSTRYVSNLTGTWITAEQATDPQYWVDHLRNTVRFADGLATVLADGPAVLVELGPGQTLSSYARRQRQPPVGAVPALRHVNDNSPDTAFTLLAFAKQWALGVPVDVGQLAGSGRRRLRLPTYPFQHTTCWIEPGAGIAPAPGGQVRSLAPAAAGPPRLRRIDDVDHWFWKQDWVRADAPSQPFAAAPGNWLVVGDPARGATETVATALRTAGAGVTVVADADETAVAGVDGVALVGPAEHDVLDVDAAAQRWLVSGLDIVRTLGAQPRPVRFAAVTSGAISIGEPADRPVDALALGPVLVAPKEYPNVRAVLVDLAGGVDALSLGADLIAGDHPLVAYRHDERLVAGLDAQHLTDADQEVVRLGDTYVVTGALGEVGSVLAGHLASTYRANLIVVSSSPLPEPSARQRWVQTHGIDDPTSRRIRRLAELERHGTKVAVVTADLGDPASVEAALEEGELLAGPIDGIVHAAGVLNDSLIELSDWTDHRPVVAPKASGAATLLAELTRRGRGVLCLVGSTSTVLGAAGQVAYVAANAYLDSLAGQRGPVRVVTIDFGAFAGEGMAAEAASRQRLGLGSGTPIAHPVLTSIHHEADGSTSVVGRLDASWHWLVDEHRTAGGAAVLPGTGHLELMVAALVAAGVPASLGDVALLAPLVVPDGRAVRVKVTVGAPADDGSRAVRLDSDGGRGRRWQLHSKAHTSAPATVGDVDIAGLPATATAFDDPLGRQRAHLRLGERWDTITSCARTADVALGTIELPADDADCWFAHPAAVDLATGIALTLFDAEPDRLHVPVAYDGVVHHRRVPQTAVVIATRATGDAATDIVRADVVLADPASGAVALEIRGLTLRAVAASGFAAPAADDAPADPTAADPFVALAEGLGIRPDEAPLIFDRALGSGEARVIASSVSLTELQAATVPPVEEPTSPVPTRGGGGVMGVLSLIWEDLLGVSGIAPDADFFELGGHSLIAIRVMSRVQRDLGVKLPLATLFQAPTLQSLTAIVTEHGAVVPDEGASTDAEHAAADARPAPPRTIAHRCLVPLRESGDLTPLFITHGAGGNVLFLSSLVRAMDPVRPVYGLQAMGIDSHDLPDTTVEAMAERYVAEIRAARPGPYLLGGYSGGGLVALEMARQLQALGDEVRGVVMFDSVPPGRSEPSRLDAMRNVTRHVLSGGVEPLRPYLRQHLRRWKWRLTPWRRGGSNRERVEFGFDDVGELGFVNLYYYFTASAEKYEMRHYDVDVLLIKADHVWPTQPDDYFWSSYIGGRLVLATSPGDHHSMFLPENAPILADRLQGLLTAFDPPQGQPPP